MPYGPEVKIIAIPESGEGIDFEKRILAQLYGNRFKRPGNTPFWFFLLNGLYSLIYRQKEKKKTCPKQVYLTFYL